MLGKRSLALSGWAKFCAAVLVLAAFDGSVHAASSLEERKLPMKFSWNAAAQSKGWIAATGIVTSDTYRLFEEFAKAHEVRGAIRDKYAETGWEAGPLGYPTSDEYAVEGGRRSDFEHGSITWSSATNTATVTLQEEP